MLKYQRRLNQRKLKKLCKFKKLEEIYDPNQLPTNEDCEL